MNNYEFWEKYNKFIKGEIGRLFKSSGRENETDFAAIIECMLKYVSK